ncbi:hypothetical protein [Curtobacterium sp. MMLR14_010]|uniref:hypothetical protein n=1 Tax=Curtobacterium sp. MMLR14_010 TaxID=1898743 RepID=UPI001113BD2D|nr:hypothetical protein [Curtobacterium sp. MMLR14_010]
MSRGRRRPRLTAATTAAGVAIAVMLSGCSMHVDAGSAGARKAEQALADIDGVRSVSGMGTNDLPFAGTVTAFVVTDDDLSDTELRTVTDEVGRWAVQHSGASVTYSARIEADGFGFYVARHRSENTPVLAVVDDLRAGGHWLGGTISSGDGPGAGNGSIQLDVERPSDLVRGWDAVQEVGAASGWKDVSLSADAWNTPETTALSRRNPDYSISNADSRTNDVNGDPSAEVAAYRAVTAKHTVTSASVQPGRLHVHLDDAADIADTAALIKQAAPETAALVDGGIITTDDSADDGERPDPGAYVEANRLARTIDRPGVSAIVLRPAWVTVTADGTDNALSAAATLAAASPAKPIQTLEVGSSKAALEDRGEDGLLLSGSPSRFSDAVDVGRELTGFLPTRVSLFDATASVSVSVAKVEDASALAAALKPVLPDGTRLAVDIAGQPVETSADLTLHDGALSVDALRSESQRNDTRTRLGNAVRDAWNG